MAGQLSSHLTEVLTAASAVQTFGSAVAYTPDVDLKVIFNDPDVRKTLEEVVAAKDDGGDAEKAMREAMEAVTQLTKHLTDAKTAVAGWKEQILPLAFGLASDVRGYNAEVANVTNSIKNAIPGLADLTATELTDVVCSTKAQIDALQKALELRTMNAHHLEGELKQFSATLSMLSTNFNGDYTNVRGLLVAEGGVIDDIRNHVSELNKAVSKDIAEIGSGALVTGVGIGLVVGGIAVLAVSGGSTAVAGGALIIVGAACIVAGVVDGAIGLADLPKVREQLHELTRDLAVIEQVMAFFGAIDTHLDSISRAAAAGATSATRLSSYYATVRGELATTGEPLEEAERLLNSANADPAATATAVTTSLNNVVAELGTVVEDWADAAEDAQLLEDALEGITGNVTNTLPSTPGPTP